MIGLTNKNKIEKNESNPPKKPIKKIHNTNNLYNASLPILTVKGFN